MGFQFTYKYLLYERKTKKKAKKIKKIKKNISCVPMKRYCLRVYPSIVCCFCCCVCYVLIMRFRWKLGDCNALWFHHKALFRLKILFCSLFVCLHSSEGGKVCEWNAWSFDRNSYKYLHKPKKNPLIELI